MIRLVLVLCCGLYVSAMVLGQDHGQKRYGLMMADGQPTAQVVAQSQPEKTTFIPAQPIMQSVVPKPPLQVVIPAPVTKPAQAQLETVALDTTPDALPTPVVSGGLLYTVAAVQANVRGGPGRTFAVLDSLKRGEQVLLIPEDQPLEGWSLVRIEGDGIEGYVSTKLLRPSE